MASGEGVGVDYEDGTCRPSMGYLDEVVLPQLQQAVMGMGDDWGDPSQDLAIGVAASQGKRPFVCTLGRALDGT